MAATPNPAATVILLRDGEVSPEVLLLERHAKSEFLPDLYVFPGGRVDAHDHELSERLAAGGADAARRALPDTAPGLAPALFVAAIRETFEEAGILLARRRGQPNLLDAKTARDLAPHRLDVQGGGLRFGDLIEKEDLELASDLLSVHARWITPEMVPRRFDTFFFAALAPAGQLAAHDGIESTDDVWIRPEDALDQARAKQRQMIFPTLCNLQTLAGFADAEEALAASHARPVVTVLPVLNERDGKRFLVIPKAAGYEQSEEFLGKAPS